MIDPPPLDGPHNFWMLTAVKIAHTAVWAFFVTCILALPVMGWQHRFHEAALLAGMVLFECAILMLNRGRCPLTALAARFTEDRSPAFDIYLPEWLARHNKTIFGTLFLVNGIIVSWLWIR